MVRWSIGKRSRNELKRVNNTELLHRLDELKLLIYWADEFNDKESLKQATRRLNDLVVEVKKVKQVGFGPIKIRPATDEEELKWFQSEYQRQLHRLELGNNEITINQVKGQLNEIVKSINELKL